MKKVSIALLAFCLIISFQMSSVQAISEKVSVALDVISNKTVLLKNGIFGEKVKFTADEFKEIFKDKNLKHITITKLPSLQSGILKLSGLDVLAGQTIAINNIERLEFIPLNKKIENAEFSFKNTSLDTFEIVCKISFDKKKNEKPDAKDQSYTTYKNVTVFGEFKSTDPDGDKLSFEIVGEPKNGVLNVLLDGSFVYKPKSGFVGSDSIEYRAKDSMGGVSEIKEIEIEILKPYRNIYYVDMIEHWAHSSALTLTKKGIVDLVLNEEGFPVFSPDETLSRKDFLVLAMKAAGFDEELEDVESTFFLDDGLMDENDRMYVMKAYDEKIISGISTKDGVYFEPDKVITRLEAAVIVSRILKAPISEETPVFNDASLIPAWAQSEIDSLFAVGVISGKSGNTFEPDAPLTKAEAAVLLCNMINYNEESEVGFFESLFK